MKIAILCDQITGFSGSERVVLSLAKAFNAKIYTGYRNQSFDDFEKLDINVIGKPHKYSIIETIKLIKEFNNLNLDCFDLIILSGNICLNINNKYLGKSIWFCHTPFRRIYGYDKNLLVKTVIINKLFRFFYEKNDKKKVSLLKGILVNSKTVLDRVNNIYGEDAFLKSNIVYAPVSVVTEIEAITKGNVFEKYYISTGRLEKQKRILEIIDFFKNNTDYNLVIISHGPLESDIKLSISGYKNIKFLGVVSDNEMICLIKNAIASIYIPVEEDFGLSPIESMSLGTPCIGVNEGGLRETIIDGKTGFLLDSRLRNFSNVIKKCNCTFKSKSFSNCIRQSERFSEKKFLERISNIVGLNNE